MSLTNEAMVEYMRDGILLTDDQLYAIRAALRMALGESPGHLPSDSRKRWEEARKVIDTECIHRAERDY